MSIQELIEDINDEITFSGALPYSLPPKELRRIIENDTRFNLSIMRKVKAVTLN